nr:MAG TPA_asm: hypothetical protein [Caudoviricetes sp.]
MKTLGCSPPLSFGLSARPATATTTTGSGRRGSVRVSWA